jgi:hypothetical protein
MDIPTDSAPAHKAKTKQQWPVNHVPKCNHWLSANLDLNPLHYKLWSVLEGMVCIRRHHNLESLKQALVETVDNFPMDVVHTAINERANTLACIRENGGHFE